ncbi:XRE family transcriptional regulator [Nitrospirillum sp. BR 11164]|jgi:transcriptional regulator with XRE-family HTH domain|uniref:helix-turn-helix domain-containing protein n=1 Tax=Nitrospirillum sp. BR 11164 TaxID=3104324 RepID=UPI002AFFC113|nr:XRE family transcriptional regulator [Nitrospirillum sp. BR 11164]MEA1647551.1 XRE family transcriptional regulator [Nitrospirillum sp. BR 11164]
MQILSTRAKKPSMPIGEQIRKRRKDMGLTLQQLADRSGLSAPFISQAERNLSVPSLVSLLALAEALEVDISFFMQVPNTGTIVHRAAKPNIIEVDSPVQYIDLASDLDDRKLDIIMMKIPPGHAFPVDTRNGEHFRYVLSGELYATAGNTRTTLKAGDSMHFDARMKHTVENRTDQEAVLLYVGTPSVFKKAQRAK